jgi:hypothetical protein
MMKYILMVKRRRASIFSPNRRVGYVVDAPKGDDAIPLEDKARGNRLDAIRDPV